jgi:putative DNA primase/helicase
MKATVLANLLGGDVVGAYRILAPGPGHGRADRSMSVLFSDTAVDGFVVSSFAGDDWRVCREHVLMTLGQAPARRGQRQIQHHQRADRDLGRGRQAIVEQLWRESVPVAGTAAEMYLIGRGLSEARDDRALRFHDRCPFKLLNGELERLPAMLAAMVDIHNSALVGIHRTALATDGSGKSAVAELGNAKKMLGRAAGACIKLSADEEVAAGLHVAEGIETALACMAMGFRPMWVALSAGGIAGFPVLGGIEALTIFADNDTAGLKAANDCAFRWGDAGKEVNIVIPALKGTDFADARTA